MFQWVFMWGFFSRFCKLPHQVFGTQIVDTGTHVQRFNTMYYCRQDDRLEHTDNKMERESVNARHWDAEMTGKRRCVCVQTCVCVCVCSVKEAEQLNNPEGTALSFLQIRLRQMMEDGMYKGSK